MSSGGMLDLGHDTAVPKWMVCSIEKDLNSGFTPFVRVFLVNGRELTASGFGVYERLYEELNEWRIDNGVG